MMALAGLVSLSFTACSETEASGSAEEGKQAKKETQKKPEESGKTGMITLGGGCFWCTEAVYEQFDGVLDVVSGYMGGHVENPTYEQICAKNTGHVEVVQVAYDPEKLPTSELLAWFWEVHDPTSRDKQGQDVGPQYRSVIFYHTEEQKKAAEESQKAAQPHFTKPIVTDIRT